MPDDLDQAVADLAVMLGVSVAELIRCGLGWVVQVAAFQAAAAATARVPEPMLRRCPVCRAPRRPDPVGDAMAHAQCDQLLGRFTRELANVG